MKKILITTAVLALIGVLFFVMTFKKPSRLVVIMLGPPGVGKGTHATVLKDKLNIPHISTGDIFRENIKNDTDLGKKAISYINNGLLVPDEIVENMLFLRIEEKDSKKGFILDGFPRTLDQAVSLDKNLKKTDKIIALDLEMDENAIVDRITGRMVCKGCNNIYHKKYLPPKSDNVCDECHSVLYQRKDDTEEVVKERLKEYNKKTKPIINLYKEKGYYKLINADQEKCKVLEDILNYLKSKDVKIKE